MWEEEVVEIGGFNHRTTSILLLYWTVGLLNVDLYAYLSRTVGAQ